MGRRKVQRPHMKEHKVVSTDCIRKKTHTHTASVRGRHNVNGFHASFYMHSFISESPREF